MSSTDGESTVISNEEILNYYKIEGKPIGLIINYIFNLYLGHGHFGTVRKYFIEFIFLFFF